MHHIICSLIYIYIYTPDSVSGVPDEGEGVVEVDIVIVMLEDIDVIIGGGSTEGIAVI